jgi:hypothetical protein
MPSTRPVAFLGLSLVAAALALGGCALAGPGHAYRAYHDEGGTGMSQDTFVYVSRPHEPKTVTLIDTRSGEAIWTYDVPVGSKLVIDFEADESEGIPERPDLMRWELMNDTELMGRLDNAIPVPAATARRLDVTLRPSPETAG